MCNFAHRLRDLMLLTLNGVTDHAPKLRAGADASLPIVKLDVTWPENQALNLRSMTPPAAVMCKITVDGTDTETMRSLKEAKKPSALLARSVLKSAYRLLAISDDSLQWVRVCAFHLSSGKTECFQQYRCLLGDRRQ